MGLGQLGLDPGPVADQDGRQVGWSSGLHGPVDDRAGGVVPPIASRAIRIPGTLRAEGCNEKTFCQSHSYDDGMPEGRDLSPTLRIPEANMPAFPITPFRHERDCDVPSRLAAPGPNKTLW